MTTFSGSFSTTDTDKTIRPKKDPVDEVIDILTDPTGGSGPPSARAMRNVSATNPAAMANIRDIANQVRSQNFRDQESARMQGTVPLGLPSISVNPVSGLAYPEYSPRGEDAQAQPQVIPAGKASSMPPQNLIDQMNPTGLAGIAQGVLGSLTGSSPAIYNLTDEYGDPLGGDNFGLGRKFDNPDTARRLGFIPVGRDAAGNIVYDVDPAVKASQERQDRDSRLDDERRERAAMLAAQQQQPVDPCPEGYRLDPVSKVCVPTDDTTQPDNLATRTYDTMTRPEPNYTPATGFTLPAITLPDILG
tara:strand:+ start:94 stop:1005 length:912 start_codon:yes stop_codon:yes gene_type:complete